MMAEPGLQSNLDDLSTRIAPAQQLRELAQRLDCFLQQQSRRLESLFVPGGDVPHDPKSLKQMMAEFERVRAAWEEQREQELQRIEQDSRRLADAWLKLEAEQRRLLGERQALQLGASGAVLPRSVLAACKGDNGSSAAVQSFDAASQAESRGEHRPASATELSMLEFQQLKREMQKHRK